MFKKLIYYISSISICSIHAGGTNKGITVKSAFRFSHGYGKGPMDIRLNNNETTPVLVNDELLGKLAQSCTIPDHKSKNECIKECITNHSKDVGLLFLEHAGGNKDNFLKLMENSGLTIYNASLTLIRTIGDNSTVIDFANVDFAKLISNSKEQDELLLDVTFLCRVKNNDTSAFPNIPESNINTDINITSTSSVQVDPATSSNPSKANSGCCLCETRASSNR